MIGALITILSLNLTATLVDAGQVAKTFPVTGATASTPITLTSVAHGVPLGRVVHGVVSGVGGTVEANGLWVLTPTDADTFSLATYTAGGIKTNSVGVNAYSGGGVIQSAFPDYQILLGRRNVALSSAVASPRIVFVPTDGRKWSLEPYGGAGAPATVPPSRGTVEQQVQKLQPQLGTEFTTFEVYVTGAANPPSPDFGDLDATQAVVHALYVVLFDATGPARAQVLHESWPSQLDPRDPQATGTQTQRGQQWKGVIEFQQPVTRASLSFVPVGTSLVETIVPVGGGPGDETTITIA